MKRLLSVLLFAIGFGTVMAHAQETGPNPVYKRGETVLERTLPPSPESSARVKYADVPFTHSTGAAEYAIPFSTMAGRELSIPIALQYRSNGIKLDEIAGVAGLGWTLTAGGCITRTVMDMPDEFSSTRMTHQMPSGGLLETLVDDYQSISSGSSAQAYLTNIVWHRVDSQLDRYSYSFAGLSGSFVILDDGTVAQLSGDGVSIGYTIDSTGAPGQFTIKGPDGTTYVFSAIETAEHDGSMGQNPVLPGGELDRWSATTAWHLTTITSSSGLESAYLEYEPAGTWSRDVNPHSGGFTKVIGGSGGDAVTDNFGGSIHIVQNYSVLKLTAIRLGEFTATFRYAGNTGRDNHLSQISNYPVRLTGIAVRHAGEGMLDSLAVGTARHSSDGRIILRSLKQYHGEEQVDRWDFTYCERGRSVCRGSQDWYGYYNSEYEPEYHFVGQQETTSTNVCPYVVSGSSFILSHGTPSARMSSYLSLSCADHDGARTRYEYDESSPLGARVKRIQVSDLESVLKERWFEYDSAFFDGPVYPLPNMYVTVTPPLSLDDMYSGNGRHTWVTTLHETPVDLGPSIRDTRVYYRKVTETTNGSRSIYRYDTDWIRSPGDDPSDRFPAVARVLYNNDATLSFDPWVGVRGYHYGVGPSGSALLSSREEYKAAGEEWELASRSEYTYSSESFGKVLVSYIAHQVYQGIGVGNVQPSDVYHYPVWAYVGPDTNPVSILQVNYHQRGNDSTRVYLQYVARNGKDKPQRLASMSYTEGGVLRSLAYTYPDTFSGEPPFWAPYLCDQHILSAPVRTDWYVYSSDAEPTVPLRSESTEYGWFLFTGPHNVSYRAILPKSRTEKYLGRECWHEIILSRDEYGNVTSVEQRGMPQTQIDWGYGGLYPVRITQGELTNAYSWKVGSGLSSIQTPSGIITRYEYDSAGRLCAIKDAQGNILESWEYHLFNDGGDGHLSRSHRKWRSSSQYGEDITWWNTLGVHLLDMEVGGTGDGRNLVTAYGADSMMHDDARIWLPYPVDGGQEAFRESAESEAAAYHANPLAYRYKRYEQSSLEIVEAEALPGYAGLYETQYAKDVCADPFPHYLWIDGDDSGIYQIDDYALSEVILLSVTDADGRMRTTYTDHAGRVLGTSVGEDAPTYHIYDNRDQLRAVIGSDIAVTDTLNMWRYSYDSLGRLASKGIPGSVREYYSYDEADRVIEIRRGEYCTTTEYDIQNRPVSIYVNGALIEEHYYSEDMETGSRLAILDGETLGPDNALEYVQKAYTYNNRGLLTGTVTTYPSGDILTESNGYNLAGEITGSMTEYERRRISDNLSLSFSINSNGHLTGSTSALRRGGRSGVLFSAASTSYNYDSIGRMCGKTLSTGGGIRLSVSDSLALQGWLSEREVGINGIPFFSQQLSHDEPGLVPSYTGLVTGKGDRWLQDRFSIFTPETYYYDYAGRLSEERKLRSSTSYTYDNRGNILSVTNSSLLSSRTTGYAYNGDILECVTSPSAGTANFAHDELGRMTADGLSGTEIFYNCIDRPSQIVSGSDTVRFRYLSDGTKLCTLDSDGSGLEYRGALTYRRSVTGSLTLESARCPEGRLTTTAPLFYMEDYLGSVRAVINGTTGISLETSDYSVYGTRSGTVSSGLPSGLTLRDHYTGCEDLNPKFSLPYADHHARFYSPGLQRWMVPDPLSEKYYGISPYAYCGGNPIGLTDTNGMKWRYPSQRNELIRTLQSRINQVQKQQERAYEINDANLYLECKEILTHLNRAYQDVTLLNNDNEHIYTLRYVEAGSPHFVTTQDEKNIVIESSDSAVALHEISHIRQALVSTGLRFKNGCLTNTGGLLGSDREDKLKKIAANEVEAYQIQYSISGTFPGECVINSVSDINAESVGDIMQGKAYPIIKQYLMEEKIKSK